MQSDKALLQLANNYPSVIPKPSPTEEYSNSITVEFSLAVFVPIRSKIFSHLAAEALWTTFQSHVGISDSALAQA